MGKRNKFEKHMRKLIKKNPEGSYVSYEKGILGILVNFEFKNFPDLKQKEIGVRKIKIKYIRNQSITNLDPGSIIWFKDNPKLFKKRVLGKEGSDVSLSKTKGKKEYRVTGGNSRIFFLKHFPKLTNNRDWIWAHVTEIDLKNAIWLKRNRTKKKKLIWINYFGCL